MSLFCLEWWKYLSDAKLIFKSFFSTDCSATSSLKCTLRKLSRLWLAQYVVSIEFKGWFSTGQTFYLSGKTLDIWWITIFQRYKPLLDWPKVCAGNTMWQNQVVTSGVLRSQMGLDLTMSFCSCIHCTQPSSVACCQVSDDIQFKWFLRP